MFFSRPFARPAPKYRQTPAADATRPARRAKPEVESLEERNMLNAQVVFNAGVITIKGDDSPNTVVIQDPGNLVAGGQVTVLVNGQQALQADATKVSAIKFLMGAKKDVVKYSLTGALADSGPGLSRDISGILLRGKDSFVASVQGYLAGGQLSFNVYGHEDDDAMLLDVRADLFGTSKLSCTFDGGNGYDRLMAFAESGQGSGKSAGVDIGVGVQVSVNLLGQLGNDTLWMRYFGDLDGTLSFVGHGGDNDDLVDAAFVLYAGSGWDPNPGDGDPDFPDGLPLDSPAKLDAHALGGAGADGLRLEVVSKMIPGGNLTVSATAFGGVGGDNLSAGNSNVPVNLIQ